MLFNPSLKPNRQATQLAYRVHYWPYAELSAPARSLLLHRKHIYLTKQQVLESCNADLNTLHSGGRDWAICWAYNNMPTRLEWDRSDSRRIISVEFRCSPAIPEYAVAILSWELPSERLAAAARGDF
jgi:hypothetical protein